MDLIITKDQAEKIVQLIQPIPSSVGIPVIDILRTLKPVENTDKPEIKEAKLPQSNTITFSETDIFDPDKIEVVGGKAQLVLKSNESETFQQTFDSDTGFLFDSNLTEITGGKLQQVSQRPANATFGATYTSDINANWGDGVLTGTGFGGASVSGGQLDLSFDDLRYVTYDGVSNANFTSQGTIRFKLTPNYSGAPPTDQCFCILDIIPPLDNFISIGQESSNFIIQLYDSSGVNFINYSTTWVPVSGTTYEILLSIDLINNATQIFIDGVQLGVTQTASATRTNTVNRIIVGTNRGSVDTSNFKMEDLVIYDAIVHNTNYTPGYTLPETDYTEDIITFPIFSTDFTVNLFNVFSTIETGSPKYNLNGQYWNGATWVSSDDSYAQMNSSAEIATNITSLPISNTLQIKASTVTDNTQETISNLDVDYTESGYITSNPTIETAKVYNFKDMLSFIENATKPTGTELKYLFKDGDDLHYWDTNNFVPSDGTYAQANTADDIDSSLSLLSFDNPVSLIVFLNSDGSATPIV